MRPDRWPFARSSNRTLESASASARYRRCHERSRQAARTPSAKAVRRGRPPRAGVAVRARVAGVAIVRQSQWRGACQSSARASCHPEAYRAPAAPDRPSAPRRCLRLGQRPQAQRLSEPKLGWRTMRRRTGSTGIVCATRRPLWNMCTTANRNRNCPSRMRHVGSPLFAVLMCRKFASEAAFSWHLPHHKNAARIAGDCRIVFQM